MILRSIDDKVSRKYTTCPLLGYVFTNRALYWELRDEMEKSIPTYIIYTNIKDVVFQHVK